MIEFVDFCLTFDTVENGEDLEMNDSESWAILAMLVLFSRRILVCFECMQILGLWKIGSVCYGCFEV